MDFKQAAILSNFLSKDYAEKIFKLIKAYNDISASEAASRLDMHIRTVQDFLDTMAQFEIIEKKEVFEKKRPYFRYSIKNNKIEIIIDLNKEFANENSNQVKFKIREKNNSGAKFTIARNGEYFSTVSVWIGEGRYGKERKFNLTNSQGLFLYYLPFPEANPLSIDEIFSKASIENLHKSEILNLIDELINLNVIEKNILIYKTKIMEYKVHRFHIDMDNDENRLERFLNSLKGEIVSIIPNIAKTSLFQIYGVSKKIDFLLIVEKLNN